jgi:hypothetical protein
VVYASKQRQHARLDPARVGLDRLNRLDRRVLGPLATILDRDFPACSQDLAASRESLQAGSAEAGPAEQAAVKLDALLKNLGEVQYALLNTPRNGPIVEFRLDYDKNFDPEREPRGEGFDLTKHLARLKERDENKPQPHYLIQMWVEASDGNVEVPTPGVGASKETFTFQVVSENELLNDIAKEEEGLRVKLEEAVAMLQDDKLKLGQVAGEMQSLAGKKPDDYKAVTQLAEDTKDDVAKSGDKVREIFVDYKRILDQMRYARVRKQITSKVETGIVEPLDQALSQEFVQAQEALDDVVASLHGANPDPKTVDVAQEKLDLLIARLSKALESMKAVTTINMIIEKLVKIEKSLRAQNEILDQKYQKLYEDLVNEATKPDKP